MSTLSIDVKAALALQTWERARRTYRDFEMGYGINIPTASKENFNALIKRINSNSQYLTRCISKESSQKEFSEAELQLYQNQSQVFLPGNLKVSLSPIEKEIFAFVQRTINYRHASPHRELIGDCMSPLKVRQFEGKNTQARNTGAGSRTDGNLFFTVGIGKHKTPSFLGDQVDTYVLHPLEMEDTVLKYAWISGHLTEHEVQTHNRPVLLGDTEYRYKHSDVQTLTKTYRYYRSNGLVLARTVHFEEEIFKGELILPAITLQFIEHLRFVGGTYQQYIFSTMKDNNLSLDRKIEILSTGMTELMPGWVYPELKIPGKIKIGEGVKIECEKEKKEIEAVTRNLLNVQFFNDLTNPFQDIKTQKHRKLSKEKIEMLLKKEVFHPDNEIDYYLCLAIRKGAVSTLNRFFEADIPIHLYQTKRSFFCEAFEISDPTKRSKMFDYLFKKNVHFTHLHGTKNPLFKAIENKDSTVIDLFLNTKEKHPKDPMIAYKMNLNTSADFVMAAFGEDDTYLELTCKVGDETNLKKLIQQGADIFRVREPLIYFATKHNRLPILQYLHNQGLSFSEPFHRIESPQIVFSKENNIQGLELVLKLGTNPNTPASTRQKGRAGFRPLHFFIEHKNLAAIHLLLSQPQIDLNAKSHHQETPLQLAQRLKVDNTIIQAITQALLAKESKKTEEIKVLQELEVKKESENNNIVSCQEYRFSAVAIVTGINHSEEKVMLLGRKWGQNTAIETKFLFPGGLTDHTDIDFIETALRELQEETGIDIKRLMEQDTSIIPYVLYEFTRGFNNTLYKVAFVHIDLGKKIQTIKFKASDDLATLDIVPFKALRIENTNNFTNRYQVHHKGKKFSLLGSNGIIAEWLFHGKTPTLLSAIQYLCSVENFGKQLLEEAIKENNYKNVKKLLKHNVPLNSIPEKSMIHRTEKSLLGLAAEFSGIPIIKYFIRCFRNRLNLPPSQIMFGSPNPLALAAQKKRTHIIEYLLTHYDYLFSSHHYLEALYAACEVGDDQAVKILLGKHVDLHLRLPYQPYLLTIAASTGNLSIAKMLVKTGGNALVNPLVGLREGIVVKSPLLAAIENAEGEPGKAMVEYLISKGANINATNNLNSNSRDKLFSLGYLPQSASKALFSDNLSERYANFKRDQRELCSMEYTMAAFATAFYYRKWDITNVLLENPELNIAQAYQETCAFRDSSHYAYYQWADRVTEDENKTSNEIYERLKQIYERLKERNEETIQHPQPLLPHFSSMDPRFRGNDETESPTTEKQTKNYSITVIPPI